MNQTPSESPSIALDEQSRALLAVQEFDLWDSMHDILEAFFSGKGFVQLGSFPTGRDNALDLYRERILALDLTGGKPEPASRH